jgi:hypothetical protein
MALLFKNERRRPEIAKLLLGHVVNISTTLRAKGHPWAHIWRLIGMLEEDALELAFIQSWRCAIDSFEKSLGPFHKLSIECNLDLIVRVYSPIEVDSLLRRLLSQLEKESSIPNSQTLRVKVNMGWNLVDQERYAEAEQLGQDVVSQAEEICSFSRKLEALDLIAHSQYPQNQRISAEKNLRHAIQIAAETWGMTDPWTLDSMIILEGWLQEWGQEEEADRLKTEIDDAIGRDEVDEELDGY